MRTVTRIALVALLGCACKKPAPERDQEAAAGSGTEKGPAGAPGTDPQRPPGPEAGLELIGRGSLPRQSLRYRLAPGVTTPIELESDVDISLGTLQRVLPTSVLRLQIGADEALPGGEARVRTRIVGAAARDRPGATIPIETVNAQATLLGGLEVTGTLTPRGRIRDTRLATGDRGLPEETVRQIEQMLKSAEEIAMPLPEPEVGVGASWRVRKAAVLLGVKLETSTIVTITALEGPRVSYLLQTEVRGDDQTANLEGVSAQVTRIRGAGAGKGVIDLGRMAMTGEQEIELTFDISAMETQSSARMRLAQRARTGALEAAPAQAGSQAAPAPGAGSQAGSQAAPAKAGPARRSQGAQSAP